MRHQITHPGPELPFLLLGAFRRIIDDLHVKLADQGHPDLRPAHAVAMRAIDSVDGARITNMAGQIGVSRQAIAKTVARLGEMGYVTRAVDPRDGRARVVRLTQRGTNALQLSGQILEKLYEEHERQVGEDALRTTVSAVRDLSGGTDAFTRLTDWYGEN